MKIALLRAAIGILCLNSLLLSQTGAKLSPTRLIRFQAPRALSFNDLVALASEDPPPPELQERLDALLSQPFLSNEAALDGADPKRPAVPRLGRVLRIAEWNINRLEKKSMLFALGNLRGYEREIRANPKLNRRNRNRALGEVRNLQSADVIVLDEIDDGVKRSEYRNVPRDLAQALHMNYAYGVEFIELNSLYLGVKRMDILGGRQQESAFERFGVDPKRDLGLEGSAILSRYPILHAKVLRLPQEYDWYHQEIGAIDDLRKAEKWTARKLFEERLRRQVRRGGRMMLVVDLAVPEAPGGKLTIICPHLEDYTTPKGRQEQMNFILKQIGSIPGPLVMIGDLNTLGHDGTPVTFHRTLKRIVLNYRFWLKEVFYFVEPVPGLHYVLFAVNYFKNYHDPTAFDFPFLLPNRSEPLFQDVQQFQFQDGKSFDWQGLKKNSFHHKGRTLSDSNQRAWKGFHPTFSFRRTYHGLVGEYKIDWIFVKQPFTKANAPKQYPFQPYFGRALCKLNTAPPERISDHCPVTVDLLLK